jgi:hypothetical protein
METMKIRGDLLAVANYAAALNFLISTPKIKKDG